MLRKDAKIELMRKVPLFSNCSKRELTQLASIADEIDLSEGRRLIKEGTKGREFFVLLEGTAEARKGKRKVRSLGPGDFFGEIALVVNAPRTASVIATSPIRALVITDRAFKQLIARAPEIQRKVLVSLAERLAPTTPY